MGITLVGDGTTTCVLTASELKVEDCTGITLVSDGTTTASVVI